MYATRRQSDDGTLCGLGFSFQATQSTGGGASGSDPWLKGSGILEGSWKRYSVPFPKVLRTFSWPVLNDDVINCPLGYVVPVRACHQLTSQSQTTNLLKEQAPRNLAYFE